MSPSSNTSQKSIRFDQKPLLLCAQALNYCFRQEYEIPPSVGMPISKTQNWKALFESIATWYDSRPQKLKPIIEIEETDEQLFPLVLFTNGEALLANQVYHTSTLLLLQNRPRTLRHEYGRSFVMSPLWHAQRICGICLSNDNRATWDFNMIASFYLAAKLMTYEPQQKAILAGLTHISSITRWNLGCLAAQLMQEWQPTV